MRSIEKSVSHYTNRQLELIRNGALMNVIAFRPGAGAHRPDHAEAVRIAEALLFAAAEPIGRDELAARLPEGADIDAVLAELREVYAGRGVNLVPVAGKWAFRTASDLSYLLARDVVEPRRLSRAAMETLAPSSANAFAIANPNP